MIFNLNVVVLRQELCGFFPKLESFTSKVILLKNENVNLKAEIDVIRPTRSNNFISVPTPFSLAGPIDPVH